MTIARKVFSAGAVGALSVILAGCMGDGGGGSPSRPSQSGVEGSWIDAQGTGLSTLAGGSFSTVATDTGQKLAEGSYTLTNPTSVQINGTSLIRQSPISFNCLLVSARQLNCTSSAGQQFVLTRRA
ncbi:hypothetical protein [Mesorhizobium sp. YM1C-6-2]|jgi:hypothetical protein|uniref:hypothetical protein n=1 Tax=Mesorhizobium sp. YM1C-6-2 TaxID=1827501 RepID=UPI000EF197C9|nr:hypothetical protein [Mesorhizobium sp. YM1C-6-2]RLP26884.1 hypothetical protein D8676_06660 [Mesorhizobium sp. YM1C-6-2]